MKEYKELCEKVLLNGVEKSDRTGVGTRSISGAELRLDLSKGFPILTTKKVPFKLIVSELLWFLKGDTNIRYLLENNNHIWDEWVFKAWVESAEFKTEFPDLDMTNFGIRVTEDEEFKIVYEEIKNEFCRRVLEDDAFAEKWGDCGRAYGAQWRKTYYVNPSNLEVSEVDQLGEMIEELRRNPSSRRLVVSSFNLDNVKHAALPCCHHQFQVIVNEGKLDLIFDMRSTDVFLGLPFNISSYGLLLHMIAKLTGYEVGCLIYHGKDVHIYSNHIEQVMELMSRDCYELPNLWLNPEKLNLEDYEVEDIKLEGYKSHKSIKAPVAV